MLLYIDPGTGSMLFSIVIGFVTMLYFVGKAALIKLKFIVTGGKNTIKSGNRVAFAIYSEGVQYWNVFKPILDEFEKRQIQVSYLTSSEQDPFFSTPYEHITGEFIGTGNKAFVRLNFLEADICLMTTPGLDVYQLKRSRGVPYYVHILHAPGDATGYRLFGIDYFDAVLLTGEYQKAHIKLLEEKRNLPPKELFVVGCPYLDVLQGKISHIQAMKQGHLTVLVAPSWGPSGILSKYGRKLLDPLVQSGFHVIVRPHPQSKSSEMSIIERLVGQYGGIPNIEWDYTSENLAALARADIMISDFSGVIFDYVFLFDRPFMYVNAEFDAKPYDAWDIPEKPWKLKILPEIGIELKESTFASIKGIIEEACQNVVLSDNRRKARDTAWQFRGESGRRTVDFLLEKQTDLLGR